MRLLISGPRVCSTRAPHEPRTRLLSAAPFFFFFFLSPRLLVMHGALTSAVHDFTRLLDTCVSFQLEYVCIFHVFSRTSVSEGCGRVERSLLWRQMISKSALHTLTDSLSLSVALTPSPIGFVTHLLTCLYTHFHVHEQHPQLHAD